MAKTWSEFKAYRAVNGGWILCAGGVDRGPGSRLDEYAFSTLKEMLEVLEDLCGDVRAAAPRVVSND